MARIENGHPSGGPGRGVDARIAGAPRYSPWADHGLMYNVRVLGRQAQRCDSNRASPPFPERWRFFDRSANRPATLAGTAVL